MFEDFLASLLLAPPKRISPHLRLPSPHRRASNLAPSSHGGARVHHYHDARRSVELAAGPRACCPTDPPLLLGSVSDPAVAIPRSRPQLTNSSSPPPPRRRPPRPTPHPKEGRSVRPRAAAHVVRNAVLLPPIRRPLLYSLEQHRQLRHTTGSKHIGVITTCRPWTRPTSPSYTPVRSKAYWC